MQSTTRIICGAVGLVFIIGCATTSYDEDPTVHMNFKGRSVVEKMSDDECVVKGHESMAALKKERKMHIAVLVDVSEQSQGRARPPQAEKLITSAQVGARSFLTNVKGYRLEAIDMSDLNRTLKSGDDINGTVFPFLVNVKVILTSETIAHMREDQVAYKCVLQWELIDNRTKSNGLGDNQIPVVVESEMCQNVTIRHRKLTLGLQHSKEFGDEYSNAQNAYNEVILNCMSQFYAQLATRLPFGGVVSKIKTLDDDLYVTIKADYRGQGIQEKMQMLILTEDEDRIAVGEVLVSTNGKSNIKIWRWLSKSYQKQIESAAKKGRGAAEEWLDENPLYALCFGLPEPPKDMTLDFRSRK